MVPTPKDRAAVQANRVVLYARVMESDPTLAALRLEEADKLRRVRFCYRGNHNRLKG